MLFREEGVILFLSDELHLELWDEGGLVYVILVGPDLVLWSWVKHFSAVVLLP